jgi:mRNA interferase RelE/StbE
MPSEPTRKHKYRLQFVPSAWQEWQTLDGSVKDVLRTLLTKRLDNPHVPGAPLHRELAGYYKTKLKKQGFRMVYGVQDDILVVMVMAVDKREDPRWPLKVLHLWPPKLLHPGHRKLMC